MSFTHNQCHKVVNELRKLGIEGSDFALSKLATQHAYNLERCVNAYFERGGCAYGDAPSANHWAAPTNVSSIHSNTTKEDLKLSSVGSDASNQSICALSFEFSKKDNGSRIHPQGQQQKPPSNSDSTLYLGQRFVMAYSISGGYITRHQSLKFTLENKTDTGCLVKGGKRFSSNNSSNGNISSSLNSSIGRTECIASAGAAAMSSGTKKEKFSGGQLYFDTYKEISMINGGAPSALLRDLRGRLSNSICNFLVPLLREKLVVVRGHIAYDYGNVSTFQDIPIIIQVFATAKFWFVCTQADSFMKKEPTTSSSYISSVGTVKLANNASMFGSAETFALLNCAANDLLVWLLDGDEGISLLNQQRSKENSFVKPSGNSLEQPNKRGTADSNKNQNDEDAAAIASSHRAGFALQSSKLENVPGRYSGGDPNDDMAGESEVRDIDIGLTAASTVVTGGGKIRKSTSFASSSHSNTGNNNNNIDDDDDGCAESRGGAGGGEEGEGGDDDAVDEEENEANSSELFAQVLYGGNHDSDSGDSSNCNGKGIVSMQPEETLLTELVTSNTSIIADGLVLKCYQQEAVQWMMARERINKVGTDKGSDSKNSSSDSSCSTNNTSDGVIMSKSMFNLPANGFLEFPKDIILPPTHREDTAETSLWLPVLCLSVPDAASPQHYKSQTLGQTLAYPSAVDTTAATASTTAPPMSGSSNPLYRVLWWNRYSMILQLTPPRQQLEANGGIIAHEMGMGKTIITIGLLAMDQPQLREGSLEADLLQSESQPIQRAPRTWSAESLKRESIDATLVQTAQTAAVAPIAMTAGGSAEKKRKRGTASITAESDSIRDEVGLADQPVVPLLKSESALTAQHSMDTSTGLVKNRTDVVVISIDSSDDDNDDVDDLRQDEDGEKTVNVNEETVADTLSTFIALPLSSSSVAMRAPSVRKAARLSNGKSYASSCQTSDGDENEEGNEDDVTCDNEDDEEYIEDKGQGSSVTKKGIKKRTTPGKARNRSLKLSEMLNNSAEIADVETVAVATPAARRRSSRLSNSFDSNGKSSGKRTRSHQSTDLPDRSPSSSSSSSTLRTFHAENAVSKNKKPTSEWSRSSRSTTISSPDTVTTSPTVGKIKIQSLQQHQHHLKQRSSKQLRTLIICPVSLISQWVDELLSKTKPGTLSVCLFHGEDRNSHASIENARTCDVVVTSYGVIVSEARRLVSVRQSSGGSNGCSSSSGGSSLTAAGNIFMTANQQSKRNTSNYLLNMQWHRVILDEAHTIKNASTEVANACCMVQAECRWALSGTPIQNSLDDLYSLVKYLKHEPWDQIRWWRKTVSDLQAAGDPRGTSNVRSLLHTIMLRRTKADRDAQGNSIVNLPPKHCHVIEVTLSAPEREFYNALLSRSKSVYRKFESPSAGTGMTARDGGGGGGGGKLRTYAALFAMLMRLRQACDHPYLIMGLVEHGRIVLKCATASDGAIPATLADVSNSVSSTAHLRRVYGTDDGSKNGGVGFLAYRNSAGGSFNSTIGGYGDKSPVSVTYTGAAQAAAAQGEERADVDGIDGDADLFGADFLSSIFTKLRASFAKKAQQQKHAARMGVSTISSSQSSGSSTQHKAAVEAAGRNTSGTRSSPGEGYLTEVMRTLTQCAASQPLLLPSALQTMSPEESVRSGGSSSSSSATCPFLEKSEPTSYSHSTSAASASTTSTNALAEKKKTMECPVCLEDVAVTSCCITTCGHMLCLGCVDLIMSADPAAAATNTTNSSIQRELAVGSCPMCQAPLKRSADIILLKGLSTGERGTSANGSAGSSSSSGGNNNNNSSSSSSKSSSSDHSITPSVNDAVPNNSLTKAESYRRWGDGKFLTVGSESSSSSLSSSAAAAAATQPVLEASGAFDEEDNGSSPSAMGRSLPWSSSSKVDALLTKLDELYSTTGVDSAGDHVVERPRQHQDEVDDHGHIIKSTYKGPLKVIIFSQWTGMLDLIELALQNHKRHTYTPTACTADVNADAANESAPTNLAGASSSWHTYRYRRLDGKMTQTARSAAVRAFNDPSAGVDSSQSVHILLVSLRAGGVGLNLTAASVVFLVDPWWNPSIESQAIDRVHRLGQSNPVHVYRLICHNTVEERLQALQETKRKLTQRVMRDGSGGGGGGGQSAAFGEGKDEVANKLTLDDLKAFFA